MKKIVCILSLLFGFKVGNSQPLTFPDASSVIAHLSGHWTWVQTCGGIAGGCYGPQTYGETEEIEFFPGTPGTDSIFYTIVRNDTSVSSLAGKIVPDFTPSSNGWLIQRTYVPGHNEYFELVSNHSDSLWIQMMSVIDGTASEYVRTSTIGQKEMKERKKELMLAPNPSSAVISLTTDGKEAVCSYIVYDMLGKQTGVKGTGSSIDISCLQKGVYLLHTADGRVIRFVKE